MFDETANRMPLWDTSVPWRTFRYLSIGSFRPWRCWAVSKDPRIPVSPRRARNKNGSWRFTDFPHGTLVFQVPTRRNDGLHGARTIAKQVVEWFIGPGWNGSVNDVGSGDGRFATRLALGGSEGPRPFGSSGT